MAHDVDTSTSTAASGLRDMLAKAERLVVQISRDNVVEFLQLLDRIDSRFDELEENGVDVRPEHGRWAGILSRVQSKPEAIVRAAGAAGGLAKLRRENPPAESFWWYLDQEVAKRRRQTIRRFAITVAVVAALLVGGYWGINTFFPPDPEAITMVETSSELDRLISEERWADALAVVEQARQQLPQRAELAVWEVVLNEKLGNTEAAQAALDEARRIMEDQPVQLYIHLGNQRMRVGNLDGAEAAAQQARELDPEDPQVYFLLGGIAENRGNIQQAIAYFGQVWDYAQENEPELAVIARVRMGQLLQSPDAYRSPVGTPSPGPTPASAAP